MCDWGQFLVPLNSGRPATPFARPQMVSPRPLPARKMVFFLCERTHAQSFAEILAPTACVNNDGCQGSGGEGRHFAAPQATEATLRRRVTPEPTHARVAPQLTLARVGPEPTVVTPGRRKSKRGSELIQWDAGPEPGLPVGRRVRGRVWRWLRLRR